MRQDAELDLPAQGSAVKSCQQLSAAFNKRYEFGSMSELRAPQELLEEMGAHFL